MWTWNYESLKDLMEWADSGAEFWINMAKLPEQTYRVQAKLSKISFGDPQKVRFFIKYKYFTEYNITCSIPVEMHNILGPYVAQAVLE